MQSEMNGDCLLKQPANPSAKATQWVFMQLKTVEQLARQVRGKIHINITQAEVMQEK